MSTNLAIINHLSIINPMKSLFLLENAQHVPTVLIINHCPVAVVHMKTFTTVEKISSWLVPRFWPFPRLIEVHVPYFNMGFSIQPKRTVM